MAQLDLASDIVEEGQYESLDEQTNTSRHTRLATVGLAVTVVLFGVSAFLTQRQIEVQPDTTELGFLPVHFDHEHVFESMSNVNCQGVGEGGSTGIPQDFSGVWWMDGIPTFERLFGAGQATWTGGEEGCKSAGINVYSRDEQDRGVINDMKGNEVPCRGRLDFRIGAGGTWSYTHAWMPGSMFVQFVCGGETEGFLEVCKIGAVIRPGGLGLPGPSYWMVRSNTNLWIRYSYADIAGHTFQYYLKQILDCSGQPVDKYFHNFNSHGADKPVKEADVFGNGGDERDHVSDPGDSFWVTSK